MAVDPGMAAQLTSLMAAKKGQPGTAPPGDPAAMQAAEGFQRARMQQAQSMGAEAPQGGMLAGLMADPVQGGAFANESFLQSQNASRGHIVQQVQNAANEIGRQNKFQLEQIAGLPEQFRGIFQQGNQNMQTYGANLAGMSNGMGVGQQSADAQMAPILAGLQQQEAGAQTNVGLLEAGAREQGTRQQGQLLAQGNEMLMAHDKDTSQYIGQREGEERQHGRAVEAETRGRDFEREQGEIARGHTEKMASIDHQYRMGELTATQAFQAKEAEKQRVAAATQEAENRKVQREANAAQSRDHVKEALAIRQGGIDQDKLAGIGDFAKPKEDVRTQQAIDSILRSYSPEDASVTKGAAMIQNPDRRQYNDVVGDKDYQEAVKSIGREKGRSLMGDGSSYWSLLPGVSGSKIDAEQAAKALVKMGKPGHAAILLAEHGKDSGSARDAILSQLNPGG
jgi:hypothetical protein